MDPTQIQVFTREVHPDDRDAVLDLLEQRGSLYETLLQRAPAHNMSDFSGWWFGAFHSGTIHALACIEGRAYTIYGDDGRAIEALGRDMHYLSHSGAARTGTQQILAEESVMQHFQVFFTMTRKRVAKDSLRLLLSADSSAELSRPGFRLSVATPDDLQVVSAFNAELAMDNFSSDPRRSDRAGHEARCLTQIQAGNTLVGRDKGKPVFLAELVAQPEGRVFLDRVYMPRALQRRKIIAAALNEATRIALERDHREVLLFADVDHAAMQKALPLTHFQTRCTYRLVVLRS